MILVSCGSATDPLVQNLNLNIISPPIIRRVSPTSGKVGDTVTIFGFGFSQGPAENVVIVGGKASAAEAYALVIPPTNGEIEALTFKVSAGAATGASGIAVLVGDNTSNNDVQFTVTP